MKIATEDIQTSIDNYLLMDNVNKNSGMLLKAVTNLFICGGKINIGDYDTSIQEIIKSAYNLSTVELENVYIYLTKKINDSSLEVNCLLEFIPTDKTSEFTKRINKYLHRKSTLDDNAFLSVMRNDEIDILTRFKAFYVMFTYHHDKKNATKCKEIVYTFQDSFSAFPLWYYTRSQVEYEEQRNKDKADMSNALESAKMCINMYRDYKDYNADYPGIYHNFCELVYYAADLGDLNSFNEYYEDAIKYIEYAEQLNPNFAKYYFTHGRLLMARCQCMNLQMANRLYDRAEMLYTRAIDLEDSSSNDYAVKITDYEAALLRCNTDRRLKEIDAAIAETKENQKLSLQIQNQTEKLMQESQDLKKEIESQKKEMLELLGFFSGVISLIIVTSQIVLNLDTISAVVVMLLFLGVMILAFSFFHSVILNKITDQSVTMISYIIIGVIMIAIAIIIVITGNSS